MSANAHMLLVDPAHFDVRYVINPWMQPAHWARERGVHMAQARAGFDALCAALVSIGCRVSVMPGAAGLPDMVFPANAGIVLDRRVLVARFRHPERQGEEAEFEAMFRRLQAIGVVDLVETLPAGCHQEGAGDCIWDAHRGLFWAGWGPRSSRAAIERIADFFGQPVVPLELVTARAYHLDVCFCPLSGGELLYYPPALSAASRALVEARVAPALRIEASADDLAHFNVNAVNVGREVVMSRCTGRLRAMLSERGYRVHEVDLSPFMLSGGGAFCMTLRLDRHSCVEPAGQRKTPRRKCGTGLALGVGGA
ncbi:MAG: hypothetical protein KDE68_00600 [Rhodocyclaceae bacterium]|nr:hypothetical protein [Rhodocyclaceae bacterium]